jgi:hypothetical protein
MPTTKERILVTLNPDIARALQARAKREHAPKATIAARILREGLLKHEDEEIQKVLQAIRSFEKDRSTGNLTKLTGKLGDLMD